ncbi:MAG: hypothetical protein Q9M20_06490 [Mariprofundaceae bacterium]|nr:hypothetical protein [Mariprofundaceae bacterium]
MSNAEHHMIIALPYRFDILPKKVNQGDCIMSKIITNKISKKMLLEQSKEFNIKGAGKLKKLDLIHQLQLAEGNADCFSKISNCSVTPCFYRETCQVENA